MSYSSRRHFIRGMGAALSLPAFSSLSPRLLASPLRNQLAKQVGTTASGAPLRMAYLYVPNGVNLAHWRPHGEGSDYTPGQTFDPITDFRDDYQIYTGFAQNNAKARGDGAGDHARSCASFLTSARARKTAGSDISLGISIDQVAAQAVAHQTRFSSLELAGVDGRRSGNCDSGYSCAYQYNLSWRSETLPMAPDSNPRAVFERLFGAGTDKERAMNYRQRLASQKSILDFVTDDAKTLQKKLSGKDQSKLDEYLTSIREIEQRITSTERHGIPHLPANSFPDEEPREFDAKLELMLDMLVLAFQTDSTRVATFLMESEASNRNFKDIGISNGHHELSHHKKNPENLAAVAKIDQFYITRLAYFLKRLKETTDSHGNGESLLHNSMIVYGSGISDGNRHNHDNLPILLAGHAGGAFSPGQHHDLKSETPLSNLYLRMLKEFGTPSERFGDSTSLLKQI